jgi:NADPH2:quinone reductase
MMPLAIQMDTYGGPDVLHPAEIALAPLQPGEIRFKVIAAAVNRADIEIRSGKWPIMAPYPFPYTPGLEALGDVVAVGEMVESVKPGERVITMMQRLGGIHGIRPGGYQEYVTVMADSVAIVPPHLDPLAMAALGLAAVSASEGLKRLCLSAGQRLVVHGATGGVGSAATLLALAEGVEVIATTSSAGKDEHLRSLGVTEIVHLREQSLTRQIGARSVDAVFETLGERTFADSVAALKRGGRLVLVGAASGETLSLVAWDLLQDLVLTGYSSENLTGDDLREDISYLSRLLEQGKISALPYQRYSLHEAARVHELMEQGKLTGRALLIP